MTKFGTSLLNLAPWLLTTKEMTAPEERASVCHVMLPAAAHCWQRKGVHKERPRIAFPMHLLRLLWGPKWLHTHFYYFRKCRGVQNSTGNKVPWKIGTLIYLPVTSRPLIFLQKEAVLPPCNFATSHLTAFILDFYLPLTSRPMKRRTLSQRPIIWELFSQLHRTSITQGFWQESLCVIRGLHKVLSVNAPITLINCLEFIFQLHTSVTLKNCFRIICVIISGLILAFSQQ